MLATTIKSLLSIAIICCISTLSFGQLDSNFVFKKMSKSDSMDFIPFWNEFNLFISQSDTNKIRLNSLQNIKCDICSNSDKQYVTIDTILANSFLTIKTSQLYKAIQQKRINFNQRQQKNIDTTITPKSYGKTLKTFEVWIQTYLPNEFANGHEGQSHCFQFIKHNGNYKLFGITSIP